MLILLLLLLLTLFAAKYSRSVTTKLDGALSAEYSDLADQYRKLSVFLKQQGQSIVEALLGFSRWHKSH
jgi:hypothetical protein